LKDLHGAIAHPKFHAKFTRSSAPINEPCPQCASKKPPRESTLTANELSIVAEKVLTTLCSRFPSIDRDRLEQIVMNQKRKRLIAYGLADLEHQPAQTTVPDTPNVQKPVFFLSIIY
jgi:hypothetical protein